MVILYGADGRPTYSRNLGAQYTGEKRGGELDSWQYYEPDSNQFIEQSYGLITAYCATLYHTSPLARAAVEKPLSYAIGSMLMFRSHIPERILGIEKARAREWSRTFTELLHLEKQAGGYYVAQQELSREARITGDALLFILYRENGDVDFIAAGGHSIDWRRENLGVHLNAQNQPDALYLQDEPEPVQMVSQTGDLQLLHYKNAVRPGQHRGFSCYYGEIARAKNLDRWWDATLERAVLESVQMGFFSGAGRQPELQARELAMRAKGKKSNSETKELRQNLKPGTMYQLDAGADFQFTKPETPANSFGLANEWTWNSFGAAVGYPPEFLLGKYSTSFTAHKGALNDAWNRILQERSHFAYQVERKVNAVLLKKLVREGKLESFGDLGDRLVLEAHLQGAYLGPVPGHINPSVEVKALQTAVEQGFMLRSDAAAKYGNNFWDVVDEWEAEEERHSRQSREYQAAALAQTAQPAAAQTEEQSPQNQKNNEEETDEKNSNK